MNRRMLNASALAGLAVTLSATAAVAGDRWNGGPAIYRVDAGVASRVARPHLRRASRRELGFSRYDVADTFRPRVVYGVAAPVQAFGYNTSGNGFGSTGYGYGGDFSTAYTSGYDDNQVIGTATRSGTYGGQPYGSTGPSPYRPRNYGYSGYGYGGYNGWSPAIPPAGGLAVYSPGAYGPGPRIVTIPSQYAPGS